MKWSTCFCVYWSSYVFRYPPWWSVCSSLLPIFLLGLFLHGSIGVLYISSEYRFFCWFRALQISLPCIANIFSHCLAIIFWETEVHPFNIIYFINFCPSWVVLFVFCLRTLCLTSSSFSLMIRKVLRESAVYKMHNKQFPAPSSLPSWRGSYVP